MGKVEATLVAPDRLEVARSLDARSTLLDMDTGGELCHTYLQ